MASSNEDNEVDADGDLVLIGELSKYFSLENARALTLKAREIHGVTIREMKFPYDEDLFYFPQYTVRCTEGTVVISILLPNGIKVELRVSKDVMEGGQSDKAKGL